MKQIDDREVAFDFDYATHLFRQLSKSHHKEHFPYFCVYINKGFMSDIEKEAADMKQKKKWVIPLCVIGVILLLCAGGLWYMINHSMSFSVGRCLVADNGSYMFIDGNSPIIMSNRKDKEGLFSGLGTGDKI